MSTEPITLTEPVAPDADCDTVREPIVATLVTDGNLELIAEGPSLVLHATEDELRTLSSASEKIAASR